MAWVLSRCGCGRRPGPGQHEERATPMAGNWPWIAARGWAPASAPGGGEVMTVRERPQVGSIRVLVVDDHAIVRKGLKAVLDLVPYRPGRRGGERQAGR